MSFKVIKENLRACLKANQNVLLNGEAGVGKTTIVEKIMEEAGYNCGYFSGATMSPETDFIGCPKEIIKDGIPYLGLVRPYEFAMDQYDAIFVDEYNRAHKSVRNAMLELIQKKSINGHKFNRLKVVWTAVNVGSEYDVEELDPAQKDRFHCHINIPYALDMDYFREKYPNQAEGAAAWWNRLPAELKKLVSPRRLDYALTGFNNKISLSNYLTHPSLGVEALKKAISVEPSISKLKKIVKEKKWLELEDFFADSNHYGDCRDYIFENDSNMTMFLQYLPKEKIVAEVDDSELGDRISGYIAVEKDNVPKFAEIVEELKKTGAFGLTMGDFIEKFKLGA